MNRTQSELWLLLNVSLGGISALVWLGCQDDLGFLDVSGALGHAWTVGPGFPQTVKTERFQSNVLSPIKTKDQRCLKLMMDDISHLLICQR